MYLQRCHLYIAQNYFQYQKAAGYIFRGIFWGNESKTTFTRLFSRRLSVDQAWQENILDTIRGIRGFANKF